MGIIAVISSVPSIIAGIFTKFSWEQTVFFSAIGIAPAILWLIFFLVEEKRKKREPKQMISYIFIAGAAAALVSLAAQMVLRAYLIPSFAAETSIAILTLFALVEESSKFIVVYLIAHKSKFFDEPVDGMLDMITGAMGFAAFENILFVISAPNVSDVIIFRFIGAVLLHAIASGFIGYHWIHGHIFRGLALATALHAAFNITVLYSDAGLILAPFLLVLASFFLFRYFDIIEKQPTL